MEVGRRGASKAKIDQGRELQLSHQLPLLLTNLKLNIEAWARVRVDHTASVIAFHDHSGRFAKARKGRLMENVSCYPPLPFSSQFHAFWGSHDLILDLIYIALLQPSFKRMLGLGREVKAELATKRVLLADPPEYSSDISFASFYFLFHGGFVLSWIGSMWKEGQEETQSCTGGCTRPLKTKE